MRKKFIQPNASKLFKKLKYSGAKEFYKEKIPNSEFEYWDDGKMMYVTDYKYKMFPKITYCDAISWILNKGIFIEIKIDKQFKPVMYNFVIHDLKNDKEYYGEELNTDLCKTLDSAIYNALNLLIQKK